MEKSLVSSKVREWCTWLLLGAIAVAGCSRQAATYEASGDVSYVGEKVVEGEIIFADLEGNRPTARAPIVNGRYTLKTTPGRKRVRITASRETGKMVSGGMDVQVPERIDLIPPQYNTASQLECEVAPSGAQSINFHLTN
jgi:hypothetical protein